MPKATVLLIDVDQSQHGKHAVCVLCKTPVAHLGKPPKALERQNRVLHLGWGPAFGCVDLFVARLTAGCVERVCR